VFPALVRGGDGIQRGERRGIVAARLLQHFFTRLPEHDRTTKRIVLEEEALHPVRPLARVPLSRSGAEFPRALHGDVAEDGRVHQFVHEANLQRLLRPDVLPREDHVERRLQPDRAWQPLCATRAGEQADLHLRHRQHGLRVIGRDAPCTRERRLESTAQTRTVNRRDHRRAQVLEAIEQRVSLTTGGFRLGRCLPLEELFDISAGNERVGLSADEHRGTD
jgi:hypothetical protein